MKNHRISANSPLLPLTRHCESGSISKPKADAALLGSRKMRFLIGFLLSSLVAADTFAADATWLGGNFLWNNGANWSGGAYPGATTGTTNIDKAVFTGTPAGTVFLPAHINVKDLEFRSDSKVAQFNNGTLVFTEGGSISKATGSAYLNIYSSMTLSGTGISVTNAVNSSLGMIGNISGTGGIIYQGPGGLQVDGLNTYTGATVFNNSSQVYIQHMANGGSASSVGASSSDAANLVFGNGMTFRYYGGAASTDRNFTLGGAAATLTFAGSGALQFTGTAAIAFSTANTATNLVVRGANTGDNRINLSIGDNGTGVTQINKYDAGKVILSGSNSHSGITNVYQGILNIRNSHALGSTTGITRVSDSSGIPIATLQIEGGIAVGDETLEVAAMGHTGQTGAVVNVSGDNTWAGKLTLINHARISSDAGSLSFTNTSNITGSNFNLTLNGAGDGSIAAGIATTGGWLTKTGLGTWRLSGASTYSGGTTVSAGTLLVNNTGGSSTGTGSVQVDSGAVLGGNGTLTPGAGRSLAVNGVIAAGDSKLNGGIGTLKIDASGTAQPVATFSSTASFRFDLNGTSGTGDMIQLLNGSTGDFVFNDNNIEFSISGVLVDGQTFVLFDGTDSMQFSGLTLDGGNRITGGLTFTSLGAGYEGSYLSLVNGDIALHVVSVPEGSTWALLAAGVVAAGALRRRRS